MAEPWRIEKIVPGGSGFARLGDGRAAFAPGALPGEQVLPERIEERPHYVMARSLRVLSPSTDRREPPCPVAAACGGCDFMHVRYEAQLHLKLAMLREALERTGGFAKLPELTMTRSAEALGYRGRVRLHVDEHGRVGFFAKRSRRLVEISSCLVAAPPVASAIATLRAVAARHGRALGACEAVEIRCAPDGGPASLHVVLRQPGTGLAPALASELERHFAVAYAGTPSAIDQRWPLPGRVELEAPPGVFTQVNWQVNQALVEAVVAGALARSAERFCDLYAGAGNFTLPLLGAGLSGVAVEAGEPALEAALRAARRQGLEAGIRFIPGDVALALRGPLAGERFDLVVIDPPRTGAREIVPLLPALGARAIAYFSCDPVTLARDLAALVERGFELDGLAAFDMFPQTHHFEVLAWLRASA